MMPDFDALVAGGWTTLEALRGTLESQHFECKQKCDASTSVLADEDVEHIAKVVSGFANASGGLFILGADTKREKHLPDRVTRMVPIADVEKCVRRIQDRLRDMVEPPVHARVERVESGTTGSGVVLIEVLPSDGAPHRAAVGSVAGRYYLRTESSTDVMPHTVLAALFGRVPHPRLRLVALFNGGQIRLFLRNDGSGTAVQPAIVLDAAFEQHLRRVDVAADVNFNAGFKALYGAIHNGASTTAYGGSTETVIYPGAELHVVDRSWRSPVQSIILRGVLYARDTRPRAFDAEVPYGGTYELPVD